MFISVRKVQKASIVDVAGSVNVYNAHELKDVVLAEVEKGPSACILNMKNATGVDSSGLGMLISLNAFLSRNGLDFRVAAVPPGIMEILERTRACSILPTEGTVLEALCTPRRLKMQ